MGFRKRELKPHDTGEDAGEQEKDKGCDHVPATDGGVVHSLEATDEPGGLAPDAIEPLGLGAFLGRENGIAVSGFRAHRRLSRYAIRSFRSCADIGLGGIRTPGLIFCGLSVHDARF